MKLAIGMGGAAFLMGLCPGCNGVLDIDPGVPREGGSCEEEAAGAGGAEVCGDANWAHWRPKVFDSDRYMTTSETVFDRTTELHWKRSVEPGELTWPGANGACKDLGLEEYEGHNDWRLPSRIELVSIVNYAKDSPAISKELFHGTTDDDFLWSSTDFAESSDTERPEPPLSTRAWCVHVLDGFSADCGKEEAKRAYCVRGGKPTSGERCINELDSKRETVTDNQTGLTWQRDGDGIPRTRDEAMNYCADLKLAGLTWRLPAVQELLTIVDHARRDPALDPESFPRPEPCPEPEPCPDWYWSSTDYRYETPDKKKQAWGVGFKSGYEVIETEEIHGRVRCVVADGC